jgi:glutamyl-tRNA reductase
MTNKPGEMGLIALVTHARNVPSEAREAFAAGAIALGSEPRALTIRTCHRAEIYALPDAPASDGSAATLDLPPLPAGGRRLVGDEAVRHLFSVAAGLDSVVVGEDQILHQLRDCLSERHLAGFEGHPGSRPEDGMAGEGDAVLHPVLERLFQIALHVGREARSWREGPGRSLADVALDRIEAELGPVAGRRLLVVGAGRMGRLAALGIERRGGRPLISNRSADRAATLAADAGGSIAPYGENEPLPEVDGIVLAIFSTWALPPRAAASLIAASAPIVDLSSPPAIDRAMRERLGPRYVSVDDLAESPQDEIRERLRRRFERLLDEADNEFQHWVRTRAAVPTIQALADHAESRRADEIDRLFRRAPELDPHERELVEQMSRRLVAGLLHAPMATLNDDASGELERAARALFSI